MKEEKIFESIANIDEKFIAEAGTNTRKKTRTVWIRWAAAAACICLLAGAAIAVLKNLSHGEITASVPEDKSQIIIPDNPLIASELDLIQTEGTTVSEKLAEKLEKANEDDILDILVQVVSFKDNFLYEGKTISAYYKGFQENELLSEKLYELLSEGESLKYGEALYEGGAPEKWAKALYEERMAFYGGEQFLNQYIAEGEFLKEKAEEDLANAITKSSDALNDLEAAYKAYIGYVASSFESETAAEVKGEGRNSYILLHMTAAQFKALRSDEILHYDLPDNYNAAE